jgi:adenine-specific DNA-methyltransferase
MSAAIFNSGLGVFDRPEMTESNLLSVALHLGANEVRGWSAEEQALTKCAQRVAPSVLRCIRERIRAGEDPLGDWFIGLRSPELRRKLGATYTPQAIVQAMVAWAAEQEVPTRVVDPGVGSGRFLRHAAREFPQAKLVGIEVDPLAAMISRANLAVLGLARRSQIVLQDYREAKLHGNERTLFIGNPPYVRHHQIQAQWKKWLVDRAQDLQLDASQLAGLHVYFFLATAVNAKRGDFGAFITAAEWLDVNYGKLVRDLFLGRLGGHGIIVIEPSAAPFPDAATTGAITFFRIQSRPPSVRLRRVKRPEEMTDLSGGRLVRRERLESERRWSRLTFGSRASPQGYVELGELCRVHRGQVTGANRIWIAGDHATGLPARVLFPTITRARELIAAGKLLRDALGLRCVVDLPEDLGEFEGEERAAIDRFLDRARKQGAHSGYIARHRRAWWSVGLRNPAPILSTYMARRAPSFSRNLALARHINIAHGLYPRERLSEAQLRALVDYLSTGISVMDGRTYAGGLTKFEPGEMERLPVPAPQLLANVAR